MVKQSKRKSRDTVNYTLCDWMGFPVYYGITNNLNRRLREHERDGKIYSEVRSSRKRSRARAEREETHSIRDYQDNNILGIAPYYNIAKTRRNTSTSIFDMDFKGGLF